MQRLFHWPRGHRRRRYHRCHCRCNTNTKNTHLCCIHSKIHLIIFVLSLFALVMSRKCVNKSRTPPTDADSNRISPSRWFTDHWNFNLLFELVNTNQSSLAIFLFYYYLHSNCRQFDLCEKLLSFELCTTKQNWRICEKWRNKTVKPHTHTRTHTLRVVRIQLCRSLPASSKHIFSSNIKCKWNSWTLRFTFIYLSS